MTNAIADKRLNINPIIVIIVMVCYLFVHQAKEVLLHQEYIPSSFATFVAEAMKVKKAT